MHWPKNETFWATECLITYKVNKVLKQQKIEPQRLAWEQMTNTQYEPPWLIQEWGREPGPDFYEPDEPVLFFSVLFCDLNHLNVGASALACLSIKVNASREGGRSSIFYEGCFVTQTDRQTAAGDVRKTNTIRHPEFNTQCLLQTGFLLICSNENKKLWME